jgi:hypothetical protein
MRAAVVLAATVLGAGAVAVQVTAGTAASSTPSTRPLRTSVFLFGPDLKPQNLDLAMSRVRKAGASAVRLRLQWGNVAPRRRPPGFQPGNPADPAYNWTVMDRVLKAAHAHRLEPLLTIDDAPAWAGGRRVNPKQYGLFAKAAARRYSGSFQGLPRVRYWLAFNEPNLSRNLEPQYARHRVASAKRYRKMLNAFATAAHGVHHDNVVVGGLLAPVNTSNSPGALKFMRSILCVSGGKHPRPTCRTKVKFDLWSIHPYTSGGPTHRAYSRDGVAFGNLRDARAMLRAAVRAGHVVSNRGVRLWVTEFSWDSKPPDPDGVPAGLEARWVSYALYAVWKNHVGMLTWFLLRDEPLLTSPYQSGLYYRGKAYARARAKPALTAFRFPFIARPHGSRVYVWGRTPDSKQHTLALQIKRSGRWKQVAKLRSNARGIFFRTLRVHGARKSSWFRAQLLDTGKHSLGFPLNQILDKYYVAFGS